MKNTWQGEKRGDLEIRECIRGRDAARPISARGPKREDFADADGRDVRNEIPSYLLHKLFLMYKSDAACGRR